jgi:hypothetical protein
MTSTLIGYNMATVEPFGTVGAGNAKGHNLLRLWPLRRMGATGLEPVTPSVSSLGGTIANTEKQGGLEDAAASLHASLHNHTADADLQRIIDAWPMLPEHVRRAILTLVGGSK